MGGWGGGVAQSLSVKKDIHKKRIFIKYAGGGI